MNAPTLFPETAEAAPNGKAGLPALIPEPAAKPSGFRPPPPEDRFDWSSNNPDLVMPRQLATAIYENPYNQIVIRQEGEWNEDSDPYICISRNNVAAVIDRLKQFLPPARNGGGR